MADKKQNKSVKDLEKMLVEKREELRAFRFGVAGSKVRDIKKGRNVRREIARILTELNTREPQRNAVTPRSALETDKTSK